MRFGGTITTLAIETIRKMDVTPACVHSSATMRETLREIVICEITPAINRIDLTREPLDIDGMRECVDRAIDYLYPVA